MPGQQQNPAEFDANRYLVTLKGRDYLEVKWRLVWLRKEHPESAIETELVRLDEGYAVFKARVSIPNGGSATGWGSEEKRDFPDFLEKAETKALGRALAALGYGTQFAAELEEDGAIADSPVERRPQSAPVERPQPPVRADASVPATDAQVKALWPAARRAGLSEAEFKALLAERYSVESRRHLSKRQASDLLDWLNKQTPNRAPAASAPPDDTGF